VTEVPALFPCEVCGLELEVGLGPGGLCWHNCEQVLQLRAGVAAPAGRAADRLLSAIVKQVEQRGDSIPAKDLASLLAATAELTEDTGGGDLSEAFKAWMEGGDGDEDPLAP
jgi:hypothetical protein